MRKIFPGLRTAAEWLKKNGYHMKADCRIAKEGWEGTVKPLPDYRVEVRANRVLTMPPFKAVETNLLEWCNERGCYRKVGELYSADVCNRIANKMSEV